LFSTFQLKKYRLKNRLGVAAMTRMSSPGDGIPRRDVLEFLVRRAQNGAAIVFTEGIVTDYESAQGYPRQGRLLTQRQIDAWKPIVRAIQDAGAVAVAQLFHCGRVAWPEVNPAGRVLAPSAVAPKQKNALTGKSYPVPDEMSRFDIGHVVNGFVETAKGAIAAGFDGVEIHGAHGYLITQFLSTYSNHRTDEYGGSVENRFRFARDIIRAVRPAVPAGRLVTFRISNWGIADMDVSLFESSREWQETIRLLSAEPVDAISVSTYRYSEKAFETEKTMAGLTREATKLPLMICGQVHDRTTCEDALKDADIVLSAKSMLLNPNWVEDVRQAKQMPLYKSAEANVAYTETPLP
jgi:2,4-dienoyl-CoA reductase-like NADH-dependent reductase (Old Yellow Enzyme family)